MPATMYYVKGIGKIPNTKQERQLVCDVARRWVAKRYAPLYGMTKGWIFYIWVYPETERTTDSRLQIASYLF